MSIPSLTSSPLTSSVSDEHRKITDEAFKYRTSLPLTPLDLDLSSTQITDEGLRQLAQLQRLTTLNLTRVDVRNPSTSSSASLSSSSVSSSSTSSTSSSVSSAASRALQLDSSRRNPN